MKRDKEQLIKDFVGEAEELLEQLSADLKELESDVKNNKLKPALINKLFREYHSIKGLSSMLEFDKISIYTHELENLLDKMRLGKISVAQPSLDALFESLDILQKLLIEVQTGEDIVDISKARDKIISIQQETPKAESEDILSVLDLDEQTIKSFTEYEEHRLKENIRTGKNIYLLKLILDMATFDQDLRVINESLNNVAEVISTLPSYDQSIGYDKMVFRLLIGTSESIDVINSIIKVPNFEIKNVKKTIEQPVSTPSQISEKEEAPEEEELVIRGASQFVRVDIQKLDEVMNILGDLVILKSLINNLSYETREIPDATFISLKLQKAAMDFEKKLNELQRSLIQIRLVPIGQIYNKLSRIVRRLSRAANKDIELQLYGGDTELDKMMIEQIFDPLVHIIRNSIDHGIEKESERLEKNKPPTGTITINAYQRGNNVIIEVSDDGRGLNVEKIRKEAIQKKLIPPHQEITLADAYELIFMPGFSTSESVTEISGRGVGLDVVKKNISSLNGSINVISKPGEGTTFEITLPITLAIIQSLIVKVNDNKFAIPMSSVTETIKATPSDIKTVDKREIITLRGLTIPLIRIDRIFNLKGEAKAKENQESFFIVIVKIVEQNIGIIADELLQQQQVVIKSLGEKFKNLVGIAGATEIGEENPILVLDPAGLAMLATAGKLRLIR
jgi:two-component system chemotaxis sensor kinase CheA